jgi:hypothetical protein
VAVYGQVLHESSRELGHGFREITRSVKNPPGHWEGIGHFAYIYYKETLLDQCSGSDFFISPQGLYAIYNNSSTGVITLFVTRTRTSTALTKSFTGLIDKVEWHESDKSATVYFESSEPGKPPAKPLTVKFNVGA